MGSDVTGGLAVIVTSYNRPRMLLEALKSIDGADLVIVADDASDFNVEAVAGELADHVIVSDPVTPNERMTRPRTGRLINDAIRLAHEAGMDCVSILCDDDLFAPGWLRMAKVTLRDNPSVHMVKGDWGLFNDGEQPDTEKLCTFTFVPALTAGNFVTRISCATEEGCWWIEDSLAVHDGPMLGRYISVHGDQGARPRWLATVNMLAGYRREHPKTVSNNSLYGGDRYLPSAEALFAAGAGGME